LNPPKRLHRVIAGFYAYHPSYESDKPAPIKTVKSASKNTVQYHYHHQHQHQDHGDHYAYQYGYGKNLKSGNQHKPKHHMGYYSKSKSKSKKVQKEYGGGGGGHHHYYHHHHGYHYVPFWGTFSKLFDAYIELARKLAEHYGHKYNYPVNLLYVRELCSIASCINH